MKNIKILKCKDCKKRIKSTNYLKLKDGSGVICFICHKRRVGLLRTFE